jgi:hypothetical protein
VGWCNVTHPTLFETLQGDIGVVDEARNTIAQTIELLKHHTTIYRRGFLRF